MNGVWYVTVSRESAFFPVGEMCQSGEYTPLHIARARLESVNVNLSVSPSIVRNAILESQQKSGPVVGELSTSHLSAPHGLAGPARVKANRR